MVNSTKTCRASQALVEEKSVTLPLLGWKLRLTSGRALDFLPISSVKSWYTRALREGCWDCRLRQASTGSNETYFIWFALKAKRSRRHFIFTKSSIGLEIMIIKVVAPKRPLLMAWPHVVHPRDVLDKWLPKSICAPNLYLLRRLVDAS